MKHETYMRLTMNAWILSGLLLGAMYLTLYIKW